MNVSQGDILAISGSGWLSNAIKRATKSPVSHVGIILAPAEPVQDSFVIEALSRVRTRHLSESIAGSEAAFILSPINVDDKTHRAIAGMASTFSADDYGYLDLGLQLADAVFKTRWFTDRMTFGLLKRCPICSYLVGKSYASVGLTFGKEETESLSPGDIYDFAQANPDKYAITKIK